MDIEDFDTSGNAGVIMQVRHPTTGDMLVVGEDKEPVTLTLSGVDGDRYQAAVMDQVNRRVRISQTNKNWQPTAEEVTRENIELLVACTLNWAGIRAKGQPLPFSVDNARVIYAKLPWLREQVKAFIEDRANFLKASAPT